MGTKNLINIIDKWAPDAIQNKTIKDYKNKRLGIDTNLIIYKKTLFLWGTPSFSVEKAGTACFLMPVMDNFKVC